MSSEYFVPYAAKGVSHRFIKLPSGITVLLLSDPSLGSASVALSVATGHHADPDEFPGLAHLCEHMVCVSSKKYPAIDQYKKMVYKLGGTYNAVTINEETTFFFNVPQVSSEKSKSGDFIDILDVFASYFDHPLFDADYTNREIIAIDNEHEKNLNNISRIGFQGLKLLANGSSSFSRFSTGSSRTLTNLVDHNNIKKVLKQFFAEEYKPDRMALVIQSSDSLNHLQQLAVTKFGSIQCSNSGIFKRKNKNSNSLPLQPDISTDIIENVWSSRYKSLTFTKGDLGKYIMIDHSTNEPILRLYFPITYTELDFQTVNVFKSFWCELIGNESFGSLNEIYLNHHYITQLCSQTVDLDCRTSCLELELKLTSSGFRNIEDVVQLFFNYITLLIDPTLKKQMAKLFSEFNGIQMYNYLYSEVTTSSPVRIRRLAERVLSSLNQLKHWFFLGSPLFDLDTNHFPGAYHEVKNADRFWCSEAAQFTSFVSEICSPSNMLACIVGRPSLLKSWISSSDGKQTDDNFGFNYYKGHLPFSWKLGLSTKSFKIPALNIFAPNLVDHQLSLLSSFKQICSITRGASLGYGIKNITTYSVPKLEGHSEGDQFWIKRESDPSYKGKLLISIELSSTLKDIQPEHIVALEVLCELTRSLLREELYPALLLDYVYDLCPSFRGNAGIIIHISGPIEGVLSIFNFIILKISEIVYKIDLSKITANLRSARVQIMKKYTKGAEMPAHFLASLGLMSIIEENTWLINDRIEALEDIDIKSFKQLNSMIFKSCYASLFVQGDFRNAPSIYAKVTKTISSLCELDGASIVEPSTVNLKCGIQYECTVKCKEPANAISYFIQTCHRRDCYLEALTRLFVFTFSGALIQKLRFKYQLGYIIMVGLRTFREVEGIHVTVMNGQINADILQLRIEDCITQWFEEFQKNIDSKSFINKTLPEFIKAYENSDQNISALGGPSSITRQFLSSGNSASLIGHQHQGYWDQIVNRTYKFSHDLSGEDCIDTSIIENLTLDEFIKFIKDRILPSSSDRIVVSAKINSELTKEEVEEALAPVRLYCFLSAEGLPIKKGVIQKLFDDNKGSRVALGKDLFKYYRSKGKGMALMKAGVMKFLMDTLMKSSVAELNEDVNCQQKCEIEPESLQKWQNATGFIKCRTISERLIEATKL